MNIHKPEDFFYVGNGSYDDLAEKALPFYHEAQRLLAECLPWSPTADLDVIDLGIGTGVTSSYVLRQFTNARITGIDLFSEMLERAKDHLAHFGNRITLIQNDNSTYLRAGSAKANAIVSAFCIHHLDEAGKKELFQLVHGSLLEGGRFVMLDLTTFEAPDVANKARQSTLDYMTARVADEAVRVKWVHHWQHINVPHPSDTMVRWLNEIGFRAETVFRSGEIALIVASKQGCPD